MIADSFYFSYNQLQWWLTVVFAAGFDLLSSVFSHIVKHQQGSLKENFFFFSRFTLWMFNQEKSAF